MYKFPFLQLMTNVIDMIIIFNLYLLVSRQIMREPNQHLLRRQWESFFFPLLLGPFQ